MQCVEKGLLDLDADISTILPEWKDPKILIGFSEQNEPQFRPAKRPLTLRYIILHGCHVRSPLSQVLFKAPHDPFSRTGLHLYASAFDSLPRTGRRATSGSADNRMSSHCRKLTALTNKTAQRESFHTFLVFEPGEQWLYGPGLEWAGLMVSYREP